MKFYFVIVILTIINLLSDCTMNTANRSSLLTNSNIKLEKNSLNNPLRLFKLEREGQLRVKAKFIWKKNHKNFTFKQEREVENSSNPLERFDYKLIQFSDSEITVFETDQNSYSNQDENSINASKYLMSIKYQSIDLPCNENLYICSLGEFITEYHKRLKSLNFKIEPQISDAMSDSLSRNICIIITIGAFKKIQDNGHLCFDDQQDFVFFLDYLSEKVLNKASKEYSGSIVMVNEVCVFINFIRIHLMQIV